MGSGHLRVYLGAAPGVGKTYGMLSEGHRRRERGTDVVIGFVETHGRIHTQEMIGDLETVPRKTLSYRGSQFQEMDVDAILRRHPTVVLVDELAHSNVPGSRNPKRWQDVQELLAAGIDVITTVNIQHLESLNDVVESITGIRQQETVPDAVVRSADQIELEDMSPEALRRRLAHGNVYAPEKIDAALGNYFRAGNLGALRELALLWLADRVDEALEKYRSDHDIKETWAARQRIVVAVAGSPEGETLLRRGAVVAGRSSGRDLVVVHVLRGDGTRGATADTLATLRQLTQDLGGTFHTVVGDDIARSVLEFARSVNGNRIVIGVPRRGRLSTAIRPSAADLIVRESGDIDVQVVTHERAAGLLTFPRLRRTLSRRRRIVGLVAAVLLPVLVTVLLAPFQAQAHLELALVLLGMLVAVVGSALIGGMLSALTTSLVSTVLTNYFFVAPLYSLEINQPENVIALVTFVLVGCSIAVVVDRSAALAAEAAQRRVEAEALNALSMDVMQRPDDLVRGLLELVCSTFGMRGAALLERAKDGSTAVVETAGLAPTSREQAGREQASREHAEVSVESGDGLILIATGRTVTASQRRILTAYAAQAGLLLQRDRLSAQAADALRLREADRARQALLAAVSHDLRTPLAGIKAAISTLADSQLQLSDADRATLLAAAEQGTDRLASLVANLLDLTRLQTESVVPIVRPVVLDEVVQQTLATLSAHDVVTELDENLPVVRTDPVLLERVLSNLIENACRQDSGGSPVRIWAGLINGSRPHVDIRIVDQGPGVDPTIRDEIFEPFRRLSDQRQASEGGAGLGLAVASGLIEVLGGSIEAEDTPGGGLTMIVSLPVAYPASDGAVAGDRIPA